MRYYRAFYLPPKGSYRETVVDNETLEELPSGALFVIQIDNDTGIRKVIAQKTGHLTEKEQYFFDYAQRQLEFKHDGGPSLEHVVFLRENKHLRGTTNG